MAKIKSTNSKSEIKLRKALFARGVRYRIKNKNLFGNPDIVIQKYKLVIFIDGEFWHGHNWESKRLTISSNKDYWIQKIERNMARDVVVGEHYKALGWKIFRFWEKEINKQLSQCVGAILDYIAKGNQ
jgi:DNA mismatch endonuclease (patch repair protein)